MARERDERVAYVGRQPILDASGRTAGYDLLFRDRPNATSARFEDAVKATAQVVIGTFGSLQGGELLGDAQGFIRADAELEVAEHLDAIARGHFVLGIPPVDTVSPELEDRVRALYQRGIQLCLDGYRHKDSRGVLLPYVHYGRVDFGADTVLKVRKAGRTLGEHRLIAIASCVETEEQHQLAVKQGFDLFQGFFFAKPKVVEGSRLLTRRARLLDLISKLGEEQGVGELEGWIREIPQLALNLLNLTRCLNPHGQKIGSLRQAIVMIGEERLRNWLHLLLYASDDERGCNNPLCELAAARGNAMERLAQRIAAQGRAGGAELIEGANLTGLLSLAAPLFDMEMKDLIAHLRVDEPIRLALLERGGDLGRLLELCERVEAERNPDIDDLLEGLSLTAADVEQSQLEAIRWSSGLQMGSGGDNRSRARRRALSSVA